MDQSQRAISIGLGLAAALHAAFTQLGGLTEQTGPAKPLTTHFVKRRPRLTKPLELKKRPQPRQRPVERKMVSLKPRMQTDRSETRLQPMRVMGALARPAIGLRRATDLASPGTEPATIADAIEGVKETQQKIDLSLELLDMEALNTGEHHAMVVLDPQDKKGIRGFCRLAVVYSPLMYPPTYLSFEGYIMPAFLGLAAAMNRYTETNTTLMGRITLNSADLLKTPWVYFMAFYPFVLSDTEVQYLGDYLMSGGFVFADGHPAAQWAGGYRSLRTTLMQALRTQGVEPLQERLPNSHALYHCYFDFDSGPPLAADYIHKFNADIDIIDHLDGLTAGTRLVAILTQKGFYSPWKNWGVWPYDSTRPAQLGVNTIIFALTQEGSITNRVMDEVC